MAGRTPTRRLVGGALLGAALLPLAAPPAAAPAATHSEPFRGRIEIRHTDDFARERTRTRYRLVRGGKRIPLELKRAPRTPSGSRVVVRGRRSGGRIRGTVRPRGLFHAATVGPGARKTAVILFNFASDTRTPWTPATVRQRVFTDPDSTSAFYADESYGDVWLTGKLNPDGDVLGWYTIPGPTAGCNTNEWARQAREAAAAADPGFTTTGYQHIVYVFPQQASCGGWAGLGEVPGKQTWMNGTISVRVVAHELGHNMGLDHASSMTCTASGATVAISSTCTRDEYGDPFDVMGNSLRHNNAWHLRQIGFMSSGNVQVASANGTYTLGSAIARGTGTQLLRVPRAGTTPQSYYDLELRGTGAIFDDYLSTDPAVQGVTLHVDPEPSVITQSLLLDATPGSPGGFSDAPLAPGRTFSDGTTSITVSAVSGGTATVQVSGAAPVDVTAPTVPGALTATPATGSVALGWSPSTDDVGVAGYRVFRGASQLGTTTATNWVDNAVAAGATYAYRVEAFDGAGRSTSTQWVSAAVPAPPATTPPPVIDEPIAEEPVGNDEPAVFEPPVVSADLIAPSVRISAPASRVRRSAVVRAVASDDVGVTRIEVLVDGKLRRAVSGGRLAWRWPLKRVRRGRHRVVVQAYDPAGNRGRASRSVRVVR